MEGGNMEMGAGSGGATGNSRWNPTREQIGMLESLYRQGIRTPSAEQIEQITNRLKVYGCIEGKNVFYWFQNHKARQRQKQKQESMAYINRYLHNHRTTQPLYPPPPPSPVSNANANANAVSGPYFLAQSDVGFYPHHQCPKVLLPAAGAVKRRGRPEKIMEKPRVVYNGTNGYSAPYDHHHHLLHHDYSTTTMMTDHRIYGNYEGGGGVGFVNNGSNINHETLSLFPLHPTGVLRARPTMSSTTSAGNSITPSSSSDTTAGIDQDGYADQQQQPFFDFFSCQASCESD